MVLKATVLGSASAAALLMGATGALAQTPPDPTVEAQTSPADPDAGAPQTDDAVESAPGEEEIVVTGIRRSLQSAQNIKRNSEQIVDTIVAEDIGKLPDIAVSDTAARIPGVQVTRRSGESDSVLIRGLPDYASTYNGREIFTAETRNVALQDFPSANIAAVEVFKSTTAELVEAGIAGLVNIRSRRPFDFQGLEVAGQVYGLYTRQADKVTPNASALISNRWEGNFGEFGALLNVSYTQLKFLDSEPSNTDFVADPVLNGTRVRFPDIQRLFYREGDRTRPSVNAALQWRPNNQIEIYAEGLYQGFRNKISDRLVAVPLFGGQSYSNLVTRDGTNLLDSGTVVGPGDRIFTFQGATFNKTDTYQFAIGARYDSGPLRITGDLARTSSTFTGSTASFDRTFNGTPTIDFDLTTPEFTIRNFDPFDPANYNFDGFFEQAQESRGSDIQARLDGEYEFEGSFLRSVKAGVRYSTRKAHRELGERFSGYRPQNINATTLSFLDFERTNPGFRGTNVQDGFRSFLSPTYGSIRRNLTQIRQFTVQTPRSFGFGDVTTDAPALNPANTFDAKEDTLAGYAQLEYAFGEAIDGVVGIRGVQTEVSLDGTSVVEGVFTPVSSENKFTDYLPNASLRWRMTPELQLRLSATQTRTRPTFRQLNPAATLGAPGNQVNPTDPFANARRGFGGNPDLKPFTSNNYDVSLEYYFSRAGFAAVTAFRRDLDGFIQNQEVRRVDPLLGPIVISGPQNSRKGRIDGFEAQFQTFFDYDFLPDWTRGFGVTANYTYLDDEVEFLNPATGAVERGRIQIPGAPDGPGGGVSKHTYNLAAFYEGGGASVRLSYNKRGRFLDQRQFRGTDDLYTETAIPAGRLDLSTNYTPVENITIFFDWTNITGNPFRTNLSSARGGAERAEFVRFLRFEESTFSLGARFRL